MPHTHQLSCDWLQCVDCICQDVLLLVVLQRKHCVTTCNIHSNCNWLECVDCIRQDELLLVLLQRKRCVTTCHIHGNSSCDWLQCVDCIQQDGAKDLPAGCEVAMLVNNLGATPIMEMYITAHAALKYAQEKHKVRSLLHFMSTAAASHVNSRLDLIQQHLCYACCSKLFSTLSC